MPRKWTYEKLAKEAKKYNKRSDFNKDSPRAYNAARRSGILDEICSHMEPVKEPWTPERITKEAKKYNKRSDFYEQAGGAVKAAARLRILDEVCSHMEIIHEKWTPEKIAKEAKKYNKKSDFEKRASGAFKAARRSGILDEVCSHMETRYTMVYMFSTEYKNNTVWKIGASSNIRTTIKRIKRVFWLSKLNQKQNIIFTKVENGLITERKLLKFGKPVDFKNQFESYTEFRELSDDELNKIYNILLDDGGFINHISRI